MNGDFILMGNKEVAFLDSAFPEVKFSLHQAMFGENVFMSTFSCMVASEEILEGLWSRINSLIAAEYQTKLNDEFSSWNIYLVFFVLEKISNSLKYTIENDTFFMRKITFDSQLIEPEEKHVTEYLNDHILGKDIKIEPVLSGNVIDEPKYSSITQNLLNAKLSLGPSMKDKQSREAWLDNATLEVDNNED
jgi:hypothetical protein